MEKNGAPRIRGGKDQGLITYYDALSQSINKVTAMLMKEVGPKAVCKLAKAMGVDSKLDCVHALALGTSDVSVYEMVGVYSTFANYGTYTKPFLVKRIEDKHGAVIYDHKAEVTEALDPATAFTIVRMTQGVVDHLKGTGTPPAHEIQVRKSDRWKDRYHPEQL